MAEQTSGQKSGQRSEQKSSGEKSSGQKSSGQKSGKPGVVQVGRQAVEQLAELTGQSVEGVSAIHRNDEGWLVNAEVLELRRVPETSDVLASYQVELDDSGELTGYRRVRRYTRAQTEEF